MAPFRRLAFPGLRLTFILLCLPVGCGGARVMDEPIPQPSSPPLASSCDERLCAQLDWIIVRDGPGTWVKNADWDQYLVQVQNRGDTPVSITGAYVVDSLGAELITQHDRGDLVRAAKATKRRYRDQHIEVKAGVGAGILLQAAGTSVVAGYTMAASALASGSGATAAGALGLLIVAPVALVGGGIYRYAKNAEVDREIQQRQTPLPLATGPVQGGQLSLFFPLAPSPQRLVLEYRQDEQLYLLAIHTQPQLSGLHLAPATK